jgi:hypothetical protein
MSNQSLSLPLPIHLEIPRFIQSWDLALSRRHRMGT